MWAYVILTSFLLSSPPPHWVQEQRLGRPLIEVRVASGTRYERPDDLTNWPTRSVWLNVSANLAPGDPLGWVVCYVDGRKTWCVMGVVGPEDR